MVKSKNSDITWRTENISELSKDAQKTGYTDPHPYFFYADVLSKENDTPTHSDKQENLASKVCSTSDSENSIVYSQNKVEEEQSKFEDGQSKPSKKPSKLLAFVKIIGRVIIFCASLPLLAIAAVGYGVFKSAQFMYHGIKYLNNMFNSKEELVPENGLDDDISKKPETLSEQQKKEVNYTRSYSQPTIYSYPDPIGNAKEAPEKPISQQNRLENEREFYNFLARLEDGSRSVGRQTARH